MSLVLPSSWLPQADVLMLLLGQCRVCYHTSLNLNTVIGRTYPPIYMCWRSYKRSMGVRCCWSRAEEII